MMPILKIEQLYLRYGKRIILDQVQLHIAQAEVVAVLGSNGAGKSTLLKAIMGLHDANNMQTGLIQIAGHNMAQAKQQALAQLAYVPELPAVYPHLSAIENIRYFLGISGLPLTPDIESCLQRTGLDKAAWHHPCQTYSKGMKQKVMLAFALAKQAKLLLLDEPNSGLDPQATEELNQLIVQCKQNGMGVLVVTHDVLSAMAFSDRLLMLAQGQLQAVALDQQSLTLQDLKQLYQGQVTA